MFLSVFVSQRIVDAVVDLLVDIAREFAIADPEAPGLSPDCMLGCLVGGGGFCPVVRCLQVHVQFILAHLSRSMVKSS